MKGLRDADARILTHAKVAKDAEGGIDLGMRNSEIGNWRV